MADLNGCGCNESLLIKSTSKSGAQFLSKDDLHSLRMRLIIITILAFTAIIIALALSMGMHPFSCLKQEPKQEEVRIP